MTEEDAIQQQINRVINVSPPARMDIKEHGKYLERILAECISIEDFCDRDRRVSSSRRQGTNPVASTAENPNWP